MMCQRRGERRNAGRKRQHQRRGTGQTVTVTFGGKNYTTTVEATVAGR